MVEAAEAGTTAGLEAASRSFKLNAAPAGAGSMVEVGMVEGEATGTTAGLEAASRSFKLAVAAAAGAGAGSGAEMGTVEAEVATGLETAC